MDSSSSSQRATTSQKPLGAETEADIEMGPREVRSSLGSQGDVVVGEDSLKLPKVDGGKDAWLFLVGCFVFEALVWGSIRIQIEGPNR
jgi:hypothetical protein